MEISKATARTQTLPKISKSILKMGSWKWLPCLALWVCSSLCPVSPTD